MKAVMDRVFLKFDQKENVKGSILLPKSVTDVQNIGVVVAIGPEVHSVKVGDRILFHPFDDLPTLEKGMGVIREKSILAILE